MFTILLIISVFYQGQAVKDFGKDFVTAFPENIAYYYPSTLFNTLKITALHNNTNFNVIFNGASIETGTLMAGQTKTVYLPDEVEEHQLGLSTKSVRISSDNDVTVFSKSLRGSSIQTNVVQPVTNLGEVYQIPFVNFTELILLLNDYNVSTARKSQTQNYNLFRVLIINAEDKDNTVKVTNQQSGSETSFKLSAFQFVQMSGSESAMKISAGAYVSVLLTHPCLDTSFCKCTMVVHQLRPANLLGDHFLVPSFQIGEYSRMFSTSDQSVNFEYGSPPNNGSQTLNPGSSDFLSFYQHLTVGFSNITTSQPVSLKLMGVGSLVDLIPVSMFSACYLVHSSSFAVSQALLIVETTQVSETYIDKTNSGSSMTWNAINGTEYSWAVVDLYLLMSQVIWHPSSKMAVYVFERMASTLFDYGGPAISINEEPDPRGCLVSQAMLEVSDQSVSWPASCQYCKLKGGYLASPSWAEAQRYMIQELEEVGATGQAWIGLRRSLLTSEWYWQTGQNFSFSNWASGQPVSPEKGMCVFVKLEPNGNYTWNSARCCTSMKPMCFKEPNYLHLINPIS
ncbi:IgGFc-binding protein-like [Astyanax mexicanus]|uniref:IgGFc-binding protein-like n=1 Tax=Astyanax mexicanus TaxID=7994 RepID=UPI0020CAE565|nr:IgGFc-binding protein-like [Astyanax mexicanus]